MSDPGMVHEPMRVGNVSQSAQFVWHFSERYCSLTGWRDADSAAPIEEPPNPEPRNAKAHR